MAEQAAAPAANANGDMSHRSGQMGGGGQAGGHAKISQLIKTAPEKGLAIALNSLVMPKVDRFLSAGAEVLTPIVADTASKAGASILSIVFKGLAKLIGK